MQAVKRSTPRASALNWDVLMEAADVSVQDGHGHDDEDDVAHHHDGNSLHDELHASTLSPARGSLKDKNDGESRTSSATIDPSSSTRRLHAAASSFVSSSASSSPSDTSQHQTPSLSRAAAVFNRVVAGVRSLPRLLAVLGAHRTAVVIVLSALLCVLLAIVLTLFM
jgi:hypothetical protein